MNLKRKSKMSKFDRYIGIDCGKTGAIAHIGANSPVAAVSMPETVEQLNEYLSYIKSISICPVACVEKVGLWRSDADTGGKSFGIEKMVRSLNEVTTVLRIAKIPFIQIYPVQWQAYLNIRGLQREEYADRKRRFRNIAQKNFPTMKVTLTNSDALLIMQFLGLKAQREPDWILKRLPESIVKTLEL
jgi:hypothetical protein